MKDHPSDPPGCQRHPNHLPEQPRRVFAAIDLWYMSEAVEVVSCYCLDEFGASKVRGRVRDENGAARKVFERCRYSLVRSENDCFTNPFGENVSCDYWEISRDCKFCKGGSRLASLESLSSVL